MIKFTAGGEGVPTIVGLGISRENVDRIVKGQPIYVRLGEMGLHPYEIVIFFGETEAELHEQIAHAVGPNTKVNIDPKLKN